MDSLGHVSIGLNGATHDIYHPVSKLVEAERVVCSMIRQDGDSQELLDQTQLDLVDSWFIVPCINSSYFVDVLGNI